MSKHDLALIALVLSPFVAGIVLRELIGSRKIFGRHQTLVLGFAALFSLFAILLLASCSGPVPPTPKTVYAASERHAVKKPLSKLVYVSDWGAATVYAFHLD